MKQIFTCKHCNKPFERQVYPSSRDTFEFCSPACRNQARALKQISCPVCGTMFSPQRINGAKGKRKQYCSFTCARRAERGKASTNPKTHSKEEREFVKEHYPKMGADWVSEKLGYTKKAIYMLASKIGVTLNKDVYRTKVHGAAKKYMTGEKNPNWNGGITFLEWGENWHQQRAKARKRDDYTCQVCGHWSRFIPVHHIKPRRFFKGHMEDANVLSNLICLCAKHHLLVEMGKIPCPKPNP